MSILKVLLFILFMAKSSRSEPEALEPNYTGVEDFKACLGNTDNFCPTNASCQCKEEKPFCRCDYFRVDWKEYWYMGPKCNHLWNTLDLILVATLPAVAFIIIVLVVFYCVNYCIRKNNGKKKNPPSQEAEHNPAFTAEMAGSWGNFYQQSPKDGYGWVGQIPKAVTRRQDFDDEPTPRQFENYSPVRPQPCRAAPGTGWFPPQGPAREDFGYVGDELP